MQKKKNFYNMKGQLINDIVNAENQPWRLMLLKAKTLKYNINIKWSTKIIIIKKITEYYLQLKCCSMFFQRLKIINNWRITTLKNIWEYYRKSYQCQLNIDNF